MTSPPCPTSEQLDDLRGDRLPAAEAEALRSHLSGCTACQQRLGTGQAPAPRFAFLAPPRGEDELGWLDEFRITGVLGEGGMSIVFDAEDTALHRCVALKVMRPDRSDAVARERFLREARLLAGLPHEHIVGVYQVGEAHGIPYLAMERLTGASLEARLQRDRWLPLAEALRVAREAAEGLAVAHARKLVHRDVKPANLWLEERPGRSPRVKLLDFGIARPLEQKAGLTTFGQVLGTPMYMAPEQAAGGAVDGRSDLYSLGCVLFQMLTGRPPFDVGGPDTRKLLLAVIKGDAPRVREVIPDLPPAVAALIQELLDRNPDRRPANAAAVVERLRCLEHDCHAAPAPPTPAPRGASLARRLARRPGLLGIWMGILVISAALLVSIGTAVSKLLPFRSSGEGEPAPGAGAPIKVGVLHSQTGMLSVHERPILHAIELAIADVNRDGGVLGRPVEAVLEDGASDELVFAEKARQLIEDQDVAVLFGCYASSARKRVAAICARHDRLLFYPAGYEGLERLPGVVYLGSTPNQTLLPLVRWAYADAGKRRFAVIGSETVYARAVAALVKHEATRLGATVVMEQFLPLGESRFAPLIQELQTRQPDLIVNLIDGQGNVVLCQDLRAAGLRPETVPTVWNAISETELALFRIGDMIGDYSTSAYFDTLPGQANRAFLEHFRDKYGAGERVNDAMVTAYSAILLWKKAVEKAGAVESEAVRAHLPGLTMDTPAGPLEIDRQLHAYRTGLVGEIVARPRPGFRVVASTPRPQRPEPFPGWRSEAEWDGFLRGLYTGWGDRWEKHR